MRVWIATGGHPFEPEPFLAVFHSFEGVTLEHVEQPDALDRIRPGRVDADAIVFYDMPGLRFTRDPDRPLELVPPPDGYVEGLRTLLAQGVGMVFLHHAIASWPTSPEFAELVGGRFHYRPGTLRGIDYPDSGYRFDVTHTVDVVAPDHPVCRGVPHSFPITDELYQFPVFESDVVPLMRTRFDTTGLDRDFYSADLAIRGRRNTNDGWSHPPGSDLVAWAREGAAVAGGRLVYLQFGDGPVTYRDPTFRRIVSNAITWVAGGS